MKNKSTEENYEKNPFFFRIFIFRHLAIFHHRQECLCHLAASLCAALSCRSIADKKHAVSPKCFARDRH